MTQTNPSKKQARTQFAGLFLLSLFFSATLFCSGQNYNNLRSDWHLKGPVKTSSQSSYNGKMRFGKLKVNKNVAADVGILNHWLEFNEDGLLVKRISYQTDTTYALIKHYEYQDEQVVGQSLLAKGKSGKVQKDTVIYSDGKTEIYSVSKKGLLEPYKKWEYNADGNLIEYVKYQPDGQIEFSEIYTYNAEGIKTRHLFCWGKDRCDSSFYFYNEKGQMAHIDHSFYKEGPVGTDSLFYNSDGIIVRHSSIDTSTRTIRGRSLYGLIELDHDFGDLLKIEEHVEYNKYGEPIEKIKLVRDSLDRIIHSYEGFLDEGETVFFTVISYTYDEYNNIIEERHDFRNSKKAVIRKINYEYDTYGNWTKKAVFEQGKPKFILFREITYYE